MSKPASLPHPPSPTTLELLIRAKLLLEHAVGHASTKSGIDPIIAIHGFDNSIEYVVRIIATHVDYEGQTGKVFPQSSLSEMLGELNKYVRATCGVGLPYVEEVKTLRQVRNLAQHAAIDITKDLSHFEGIARKFFDRTIELVFGLNSSSISISQLIENEAVRKLLEEAEGNIKYGKFMEAVEAARDAFDNAYLLHSSKLRLRRHSVPALATAQGGQWESAAFIATMSDELQNLRVGINSTKRERFDSIIDHIPYDRCIEKKGNAVLTRPWEESDAQFCLNFASEYALKWQIEEIEPLTQPARAFNEYSHLDLIDGLEINNDPSLSCVFGGFGREGYLWYVDAATIEEIRKLKLGSVYTFSCKHFTNGKLGTVTSSQSKLAHMHTKVVTYRPARWEVFLSLERIPFTWRRDEYQDGDVKGVSVNINSASADELCSLYPVDEAMALKIIDLRNALGRITKVEQLQTIAGIKQDQLDWLTNLACI